MRPKEEFELLINKIYNDGSSKMNFIYSWGGEQHVPPERNIIDYASFFLQCPSYLSDVSEDEYYEIKWDSHSNTSNDPDFLTIFIVSMFLSSMKDIIHSGLKKDYIVRTENLKSKVKGRILHSYNIRKNIISGHQERFYCSFQEYTEDIPINRFLKAILYITRDLVASANISEIYKNNTLHQIINLCLSSMQAVSLEPSPRMVVNVIAVPHGKLFRNYEKAIEFGRMILELDNAFFTSENGKKRQFPDFWVYLPTLFEHYLYGKMNTNNHMSIVQPKGLFDRRADFIFRNPDMVVDAKFKPRYHEGSIEKDDYIQLSGYARDEIYFPNNTEEEVPCFIVYPILEDYSSQHSRKKTDPDDLVSDEIQEIFSAEEFYPIQAIPKMRSFYKVGIRIPCKKP